MSITVLAGLAVSVEAVQANPLRVGAAVIDVSPLKLPVIVNGGFLSAQSSTLHDRLNARGIVIDDGITKLAIVVVDTCMMPRELVDRAKTLAREQTGIAVDRMLISATHTHSAPAAMGALGTPPDEAYVAFLPAKLAECIAQAAKNLEPAQVGWTVIQDYEHTHNRRWIYRPDKMRKDPFGDTSVRANMHPGYQNPDTVGPSGPVDPGLSIVAFQTLDGKPLALLANYSMHYFGTPAVSADYFGHFAAAINKRIQPIATSKPCVAIMSQGTSGDQHWMDYSQPPKDITVQKYAEAVASRVHEAYKSIKYQSELPVKMAETRISLRRRNPDAKQLEWAKSLVAKMPGPIPRNQQEVYAKEAIYLHDDPIRELKLQAIRLGDVGIAAIPNEVYAITGLKIKERSPLSTTFTVELANGSEGYIPPPEQHRLGGYTTWPARTAALETDAETKIVESVSRLLENVSGQPRRDHKSPETPYSRAILASNPSVFWRLGELEGDRALDATGHNVVGTYEGNFAFYLDGPGDAPGRGAPPSNRAVQFVGGGMKSGSLTLGRGYTVSLWFWSGMPNGVRESNGEILKLQGVDKSIGLTGDGRLRLSLTTANASVGSTLIASKTWHNLTLTCEENKVIAYLDGLPEIARDFKTTRDALFLNLAGGSTKEISFEGKMAEVAVHNRPLTAVEIAKLARMSPRAD